MLDIKKIFLKKKILIYGLGKSGLSAYYFLRKNNDLYLYDDNINIVKDIVGDKKGDIVINKDNQNTAIKGI